jgi:hypothetical protein
MFLSSDGVPRQLPGTVDDVSCELLAVGWGGNAYNGHVFHRQSLRSFRTRVH